MRSITLVWALQGVLLLALAAGCGDDDGTVQRDAAADEDTGPAGDSGPEDTGPAICEEGAHLGEACESAADCSDNCYCNGEELCEGNVCVAGTAPCSTSISCAEASCDEEMDLCDVVGNDAMCSDGDICNGAEVCDLVMGMCRTSAPPYCNDEDSCTVDSCDSATGCVFLARDLDGDGHRDGRCGGDDCDDDPRFGTDIYPGAEEDCFNRRDDNCDGLRDFNEPSCVPTNDTCETARVLPGPGTYSGATRSLRSDYTLSCGNASGADAVFAIDVPELSDVRITVSGGSGTSVAFQPADSCGGEDVDIGCVNASPASMLRRSIEPGTYNIIVKQSSASVFDLTVRFMEPTMVPPVNRCDSETQDISMGGSFTGLFEEVDDLYEMDCSGRGRRDAAYRLVLDSPKDVTLSASTVGGFGTTFLSVTPDCTDEDAALFCRSVSSGSPARLRELPAGTYYVLLETSSSTATSWNLEVTVTDPVPRQPGDACSTAVDITPPPGMDTGRGTASLEMAELDTGTGCGGTFGSYRDLFFSFTLTETKDVDIATDAGSNFHYTSVRELCPSIGSERGCLSGSDNRLSFRSLEPGTYYVTASRASASGDISAEVTYSDPTPIPPNDRCPGAIDISGGYSARDTLVGFGDDVAGCSGFRLLDAFYTFTLTEAQDVNIVVRRADGTFGSHTLTLREGGCEADRNLACDSGSPAILSRTLEPGTYTVIVEGPSSGATDFIIQATFFDPI